MVLGSHVILSAYGFWLPNDPRGSWSKVVRKWELARYGEATKVDTRLSVAAKPHNREWREEAKQELAYPAVEFYDDQISAIGEGFRKEVERYGYTIWACAILPLHMHLVVARFRYDVEKIVLRLKAAATTVLIERGIHPLSEHRDEKGKVPRCFAQNEWKVFLDSPQDIVRSIEYTEANPEKEGRPRQQWNFVTKYVPPFV